MKKIALFSMIASLALVALATSVSAGSKPWGIVVDTDTDKAWGIVVDTDSSQFTYYADASAAPQSVTCSNIDPESDYVKCMIAGTQEDKVFGIVVDGDSVPAEHLEQGDKAWGIVVDETDSLQYFGSSPSNGDMVDCQSLGDEGMYQVCSIIMQEDEWGTTWGLQGFTEL